MDKQELIDAERLKSAISFTNEDLDFNRRGELSLSQKHRLKKDIQGQVVAITLLIIIFSGLLFSSFLSSGHYWAFIVCVLAVVLFAWMPAVVTFMTHQYRIIDADGVYAVEGLAQLEFSSTSEGNSYCITINNIAFSNITKKVYLAFIDSRCYRVYYFSSSKQILSAEIL